MKVWHQMNDRERVLAMVRDRVADLLYYHRKEDAEFPPGKIEFLVEERVVSIDDMVEEFRTCLKANCK